MEALKKLSEEVGYSLQKSGQVLVSAESCTGGGIAMAITEISGSSEWFDRAFVTYSNAAKIEMLGVNPKTLELNGAVSQPVVEEMAFGALNRSNGTIAVSVSGVAGPTGGSEEKPVGTVWFGWRYLDKEQQECCHFDGDRAEVRYQACMYALKGVLNLLNNK